MSDVNTPMRLSHCHNHHDFRELARRRLPAPIFNYIDGGADDELTLRRNSENFERCDLVPNVLRGAEHSRAGSSRQSTVRAPQQATSCVACQGEF